MDLLKLILVFWEQYLAQEISSEDGVAEKY